VTSPSFQVINFDPCSWGFEGATLGVVEEKRVEKQAAHWGLLSGTVLRQGLKRNNSNENR
jgi:hypothetical protein